MDLNKLKDIAARLDEGTVQSLVHAVRLVVDAAVHEAEAVAQTQTPPPINYATADHDHGSPPGGWQTTQELRHAARQMTAAVAAEQWVDGVVAAFRVMALVGVV